MNTDSQILPQLRLKLNVDNPNLEDVWTEGYEVSMAGGNEETNPYKSNSVEHEHWSQGWWAGFYGEEPLYTLSLEPQEIHASVADITQVKVQPAANASVWMHPSVKRWAKHVVRIAGAIAATAVVGYQLIDMVA